MSITYPALLDKVMTGLRIRNSKQDSAFSLFPTGFYKPFITIARDPGSGGHPIGRMVAKELNFQFLDDEILEDIAKSTKKRKEVLQNIDEKGRSAIDDLLHGLLNPEYVSDITYVSELIKVVLSHAYKGHVVILGRGANFITPFAQGLHVRITAPYSVRVRRAIDFEGHTPEKAREVIAKVQKDRKEFVKQYLRKDIEDTDAYDLSINTTYFTPAESTDLITRAFHAKFGRFKLR